MTPGKNNKIHIGSLYFDKQWQQDFINYFTDNDEYLLCFNLTDSHLLLPSLAMQPLQPNDPATIQVLLIDLCHPQALNVIEPIKQQYPEIEVMIITRHPDIEMIFTALYAGATGYLLKSSSMAIIARSIIELYQGGTPVSAPIARQLIEVFQRKKNQYPQLKLTPRENQVVDGLIEGLAYKQIAQRLTISVETVRHHIKNIYSKLKVNSKSQAIAKLMAYDL